MSEEITILNSVESVASTVSLRSDEIMLIFMKPNITLKLSDAVEILNAIGKLGSEKKYRLLFIAGSYTLVDTETRAFGSSKEANKYTIASAFVVNNIAQQLLGNAYIKFNKPPTPTKLFTSEAEAVKWLQSFS